MSPLLSSEWHKLPKVGPLTQQHACACLTSAQWKMEHPETGTKALCFKTQPDAKDSPFKGGVIRPFYFVFILRWLPLLFFLNSKLGPNNNG